jgi:2-dehydropantoate 2-reductase
MKIAVIGSGAMGCLYSGLLSAENEVTVICSNESTAEFINKNGISITESDNSVVKSYPCAVISGEYNQKSELVIIFVKAYDTKSAIEDFRTVSETIKLFLNI